jgi:hypothetical protein
LNCFKSILLSNEYKNTETQDFISNIDDNTLLGTNTVTFEELDYPITKEEILASAKRDNRNKAPGIDNLLSKYL